MIFDTHAHYDDRQFENDRYSLLDSMKEAGIGTIVNNAADLESVETSLELAHRYDFVYAAVGVHPENAYELDDSKLLWLRDKSHDPKAVAIGEIGLDYHYPDNPDRDTQIKWFRAQLRLALEEKLPVVIHSRDAAADTMEIMKEAASKGIVADIHCYSYSPEQALEYVKMGFYIGVGGVVTFKNGKKLKQTVDKIPLDRILLETDCPYMAPEPFRGSRNSSVYLPYVVKAIADIKGVTPQEVVDITEQNARRFYGIRS
ncbi:TatD family hydrolase [Butyrivibrio fibrisolvens]|uniref:Hydrolase TatD n=2 Tax=Butyrivibrio fibrisolvens TaxID=831 RepID=A0A317G2P8_BUTFI|nr:MULTISPECIES: TatD family hydrolase [Butyrivibrio]MCR4634850.1 TatD family hydrolase [Butyrivibrio sp.]PWT26690.1 hydrolase TatD [Butyrivibrio fibrisolvens]